METNNLNVNGFTYRKVGDKFYVYYETDTQFYSVDGQWYAAKSDKGAAYVGREYATEKAAKRGVRYYGNKCRQDVEIIHQGGLI